VIQRWNDQLSRGRDMLWSPTIRAALIAGTPWLDVFCPGCGKGRAIEGPHGGRRGHVLAGNQRAAPILLYVADCRGFICELVHTRLAELWYVATVRFGCVQHTNPWQY
jgi:hypothetical protein